MSYTLYLFMYFHKYNTSQTQNRSTVKHCTRRRAAWDPCPLHPPSQTDPKLPTRTKNNISAHNHNHNHNHNHIRTQQLMIQMTRKKQKTERERGVAFPLTEYKGKSPHFFLKKIDVNLLEDWNQHHEETGKWDIFRQPDLFVPSKRK